MKKIIVLIFLLSIFCGLNFSVLATEKIEGSTSFTWDKLTQTERDTDIQTIRKKIFTGNVVYSYDKDVFEKKYADFKKDYNYKENMIYAKIGFNNLEDRIIVPFYWKKLLYGYGIIYKKDLKHCYYYTALGSLFTIEIFERSYDKYPVVSYQYNKKGRLTSGVYSLSDFDEYMYNPSGIFLGRWYKENYYNAKGKIVMSRILPE